MTLPTARESGIATYKKWSESPKEKNDFGSPLPTKYIEEDRKCVAKELRERRDIINGISVEDVDELIEQLEDGEKVTTMTENIIAETLSVVSFIMRSDIKTCDVIIGFVMERKRELDGEKEAK